MLVCTVYSVLYSGIALSRKPFGIGHMYIYTFWLRMTDTMTSQNIHLSSSNTLYTDTKLVTIGRFVGLFDAACDYTFSSMLRTH
jgi:hypothetical protein